MKIENGKKVTLEFVLRDDNFINTIYFYFCWFSIFKYAFDIKNIFIDTFIF